MSRPLRIEFDGAWYHVMNRGAGRRTVFPDDRHYRLFLDLLDDVHERYDVQCHGYALMGNHYHLLLHTPRSNLARTMRHINGVYTQRHNRIAGSDGALFRGRYKSILIDENVYLLQVGRYIHRNPVEAGLCDAPEDYTWSSYAAYVGHARAPRWLYRRAILEQFGPTSAVQRYRAFMEQAGSDGLADPYEADTLPAVLGTDSFLDACRERMSDREPDRDVTTPGWMKHALAVEHIVDAVAREFGIEADAVRAGSDPRTRLARSVAMWLCRSPGGYRLRDIASAFGVASYFTVSTCIRRLAEKAKEHRELALTLAALRTRLLEQ